MKIIFAAALAAMIAAPAAAQLASPLPAALSQAQKLVRSAPKGERFDLIYQHGSWNFFFQTPSTGPGLTLTVYEGEHVRLTFTDQALNGDEEAFFDMDGFDAVVNGKPSHGIHVFLQQTGDSATAEFDAPKEGFHFIQWGGGIIGKMIVLRK